MRDKRAVRDSEAACFAAFKVVVWLRRQQLMCLSTHDCRFHLFPCQSVNFLSYLLFSGWITTTSRSFSIQLLPCDSLGKDLKCIQTNTYMCFFSLSWQVLANWGPQLQSLGWLQIVVWRKVSKVECSSSGQLESCIQADFWQSAKSLTTKQSYL